MNLNMLGAGKRPDGVSHQAAVTLSSKRREMTCAWISAATFKDI